MDSCPKCSGTERDDKGKCLSCKRASGRDRSKRHYNKTKVNRTPTDRREETIERGRLRKYGLTVEQYQALLKDQVGLCRLCHTPFGARIHIDHDHVTGRVRGLLCHPCNVGLGHFKDNPNLLRAAASYLESEPTDLVVVRPPSVYRPGDGRHKVTDSMRGEIRALRKQGLSLGTIAKKAGLSRSWVQVILGGD